MINQLLQDHLGSDQTNRHPPNEAADSEPIFFSILAVVQSIGIRAKGQKLNKSLFHFDANDQYFCDLVPVKYKGSLMASGISLLKDN